MTTQTKLAQSKDALRREVRAGLAAMSADQRAADSHQACDVLRKQRVWQAARSILFFAPTAEELDVWPLLDKALGESKIAALPRFSKGQGVYIPCRVRDLARDVAEGHFNIREPVARCEEMALNRLDLILVPGVAFDLHGRRLGRGKGFYDQMLAGMRGTTCGVAFEQQLVLEVPVEPHDIHLNCVVTPTRWIEV